jgi:hypothetical protein
VAKAALRGLASRDDGRGTETDGTDGRGTDGMFTSNLNPQQFAIGYMQRQSLNGGDRPVVCPFFTGNRSSRLFTLLFGGLSPRGRGILRNESCRAGRG